MFIKDYVPIKSIMKKRVFKSCLFIQKLGYFSFILYFLGTDKEFFNFFILIVLFVSDVSGKIILYKLSSTAPAMQLENGFGKVQPSKRRGLAALQSRYGLNSWRPMGMTV